MKKLLTSIFMCLSLFVGFSSNSLSAKENNLTFKAKKLDYEKIKKAAIEASNKNAKSYYDMAINALKNENDDVFIETTTKWEKESPKDPELFIVNFNYYLAKGYKYSIKVLENEPEHGQFYKAFNKEKGVYEYITEVLEVNDALIDKGENYLYEGLTLYPVRQDMWFGLINSLIMTNRLTEAKNAIFSSLDVKKKSGNKWLWSFNTDLPYNEDDYENDLSYIEAMNDYLNKYYEKGTKEALLCAQEVTEKLVKEFPSFVPLYNYLGIIEVTKKHDVNKALFYFNKAYEIDNNDLVIVGNLAYLNALAGNKENFDKFVDILLKSGNKDSIGFAENLKKDFFNK